MEWRQPQTGSCFSATERTPATRRLAAIHPGFRENSHRWFSFRGCSPASTESSVTCFIDGLRGKEEILRLEPTCFVSYKGTARSCTLPKPIFEAGPVLVE